MHELSIVLGLCDELERLRRENHAARVTAVALEVGAVSNVVPQLLRDAFDAVRANTPLIARASLEIRELPVVLFCHDCEQREELDRLRHECPRCRGHRVSVEQGKELLLRQVELEFSGEEPAAAAAPLEGGRGEGTREGERA